MSAATAMGAVQNSVSDALAIDLDQAGQAVGVCAKTLRREIDRGNLRGLKIGRQWRVRVSELQAYLKRQESKGNPLS